MAMDDQDFPCVGYRGCENRVEEEGEACGECEHRDADDRARECPYCGSTSCMGYH